MEFDQKLTDRLHTYPKMYVKYQNPSLSGF